MFSGARQRIRQVFTSCSIPEYSPSVFSRMRTVSTLSYGVLNPLIETQGRTFAKRLNVRLRVKFNDTCPFPTIADLVIRIYTIIGDKLTWGCKRSCVGKRTIRDRDESDESVRPPFKATVFFLTDWIAFSGMTVLPPFNTGVTLTSSHCIGTYKTLRQCTDAERP